VTDFLKHLCDEFTKRCNAHAIVAGGSVRDVLMGREPKDFDVFVLCQGELADNWHNGLEKLNSPEWHKSEPYLQRTLRVDGRVVQVMRSNASNVGEVLDLFDWNVSRFAYDPKLTDPVIKLTELSDIAEGKPLKLHRVTFPVSTLRRGFRFSERFSMVFQKEDLRDLCALAASRLVDCTVGPNAK
jgi:hypothetical protein